MNLLKIIFLTKKEKEYLDKYQERYHKFSSLKERNYVLNGFREYEKTHKNWSQEKKIEAKNIIYKYYGVSSDEELKKITKDEDDFLKEYKNKYGDIKNETEIIIEYLRYKQLSKKEAIKKVYEKINS